MDLLVVLLPIVAIVALLIGYLMGGRPAAALRRDLDAQGAVLRAAELRAVEAEAQGRELPPLRLIVDEVRRERDAALTELARADERQRAHEAQVAALRDAKDALSAQFSEIGQRLLGDAQKAFLERADQRFAQAGEKSEEKLKALLNPVGETLKRYEEGLAKVEKERAGSYGELKEAITQLTQGNDLVRRETQRLANVMRSSPKARGRWGEEQLKNILVAAGLAENVDFALQTSVSDGERQLRPDCIVNLPGERCIVIDVKCPLVHFEQAFDEEDEGRRGELLLQHAGALKSYANDLGRKGYWRQFDRSPDFVIMFVPGEHFLSAAAERAPDLIESAFKNGVIVASTINMLALAKVMAGMWRQESLAQQAQEIAVLGKDLYARLTTMGGHVAKLGRNLGLASGAYNDFVGSLESQVLTQARRFEALKIETGGKTIDTLPVVEAAIRPLTKLATVEEGDRSAARQT
ncbi:DNA recombination protein RmuC [Sphingomonas sp. ID0503]|uniref:DNA recombination protein RmuC n=1 Tax=Sphingomonas sp. ID0503 TaxID=3399691 RepID=UPI003AFB2F6C